MDILKMPNEVNISRDVEDLVTEIIARNGFNAHSKITYDVGFQAGDGFLSRSIAVTVSDDQRVLELFVKCGLNLPSSTLALTDRYYANEIRFYEKIAPAIATFLREKNIRDGFTNLPKCYGTSNKNIIVLENLKKKGYELCDKTKPLNDKYISLVFKTFAKFHAVCFALKDQKPELYQKVTESAQAAAGNIDSHAWDEASKNNINNFLASLDPIKDKHILNRTEGLAQKLFTWGNMHFYNPDKTDYDILTQADCWCNNMMFLFEENNKENPFEIVLLDWQMIKVTLPVFDLACFFYTGASEEAMKNIDNHLKLYHEELSHQLTQLGSDPEVLYPYSVFKQHWNDKAKFGLHMAFMLIRMMLFENDEVPDFETIDISNFDDANYFFRKIKNNDEYCRRMKIILEHMIEKDYI